MRKRYNSFDANIGPVEGNEENLAPSSGTKPCRDMKPDQRPAEDTELLSGKSKRVTNSPTCDETDDEISFRDIKFNGDSPEDGKNKVKRKSNAERFLEDNANYFQLEVLSSKTRSNKLVTEDLHSDSEEEEGGKGGFHTSFFDFLKSKGVEKDSTGRSRHKSAESDLGDRNSRALHGRSRSSHSRYRRSRSSGRPLSGRDRSLSKGRIKNRSSDVDCNDLLVSESESDCSVRLPRLELGRVITRNTRSESPSESSEISFKSRRGKSLGREATSESENEPIHKARKTRTRSAELTSESEADFPQTVKKTRSKSVMREVSPDHEVSIKPRRIKPIGRPELAADGKDTATLKSGKSPLRDTSPSGSEAEVAST